MLLSGDNSTDNYLEEILQDYATNRAVGGHEAQDHTPLEAELATEKEWRRTARLAARQGEKRLQTLEGRRAEIRLAAVLAARQGRERLRREEKRRAAADLAALRGREREWREAKE
jgi:hypothetical protein